MRLPLGQLARVMLATLALHAAILGIALARHDGDISGVVCVGENRFGRPPFEAVTRCRDASGHDGQFYYALARSPWTPHPADLLEAPAYRHVRILYPAVCWGLTHGDPVWLLYVMPAVNLLAVCLLAGVGAAAAVRLGHSPWWGFVLPLGVNAGISVVHDFTDCVSTLAAVGLLLAWTQNRVWWVVTLWAAAAVFSREQNLALCAFVGLAALATGRRGTAASLVGVATLWTAWAALLWGYYGALPYVSGSNFGPPGQGLWGHLSQAGDDGIRFSLKRAIIEGAATLHLALLACVGLWVATWRVGLAIRLTLAAGAVLVFCGGPGVYADLNSYLRVFAWVPIGIWVGGLTANRTWPLWLLTPGAAWCLIAAWYYV